MISPGTTIKELLDAGLVNDYKYILRHFTNSQGKRGYFIIAMFDNSVNFYAKLFDSSSPLRDVRVPRSFSISDCFKGLSISSYEK